jgi:hypothetical protein
VGAEDGMEGIEIKSIEITYIIKRRKTEETTASLIGSRESTLFLGLKYAYWHDGLSIYVVRNGSSFWCVGCRLQRVDLVPRSKERYMNFSSAE